MKQAFLLAHTLTWLITVSLPITGHALQVGEDSTHNNEPIIRLDTVIHLTFEHSQDIAAARYDMQAAEYQFQEFERGLSQFTPLIVDSRVQREVLILRTIEGERERFQFHRSSLRVGARKNFFNGASLFGGLGRRGVFGADSGDESNPFVEAEARFPLFGSFTTLRRITDRSFEENEMFNARLDYVDTVRETILAAMKNFLEVQRYLMTQAHAVEALEEYRLMAQNETVLASPADLSQVNDEIQFFLSQLVGIRGDLDTERVKLLDLIGLENVPLEEIENLDLLQRDDYWKDYMDRTAEELIEIALANDAEIQVLENAKENSELKLALADRGKWDIFGSLAGRYDFIGDGNPAEPHGYLVEAGLNMQLSDPVLLSLSRRRAQAEIDKFTARIERRRLELSNQIQRQADRQKTLRSQILEEVESVRLRREVYDRTWRNYLEEPDSMYDVTRARMRLYEARNEVADSLNRFFDVTTELDEQTGVFFQRLGLDMNTVSQ